ncbi:DUF4283 domain protein, partial [Trifolium medium]|nr:DUF4283 domain protein [Trifolium medium]
ENVLIPWSFLVDPSEKQSPQSSIPPPPKKSFADSSIPPSPKKSFADAVSNVCDIPPSQMPLPVIKGDSVSISIPEEEYQSGV